MLFAVELLIFLSFLAEILGRITMLYEESPCIAASQIVQIENSFLPIQAF